MRRWISYIKSLNPEIRHIAGKNNAMADMLSRARFEDENDMVSEDEDKGMTTLHTFNENEYEGEWLLIGRFLRTMMPDASWTKEEALRIRKKAYQYFLKGGFLWRRPKRTGMSCRVVVRKRDQITLMSEFHESPWAGHRGTWATFEKLKEKFWWPSTYKDVLHFVSTCQSCQLHSNIRCLAFRLRIVA